MSILEIILLVWVATNLFNLIFDVIYPPIPLFYNKPKEQLTRFLLSPFFTLFTLIILFVVLLRRKEVKK